MTDPDDDVEYCEKCGYAEYDEDGNETHADKEEYDHDFEIEEESSFLEGVKDLADTVKSVAEAGSAIKKFNEPSRTDYPELNPNKFKVSRPKFKIPDLGPIEHPDAKAEKRHEKTIKWTKIGIIVAIALSLLFGIPALI